MIFDRDIKIETYPLRQSGGQQVSYTSSGVKLTHVPTGISVHSEDERSQIRNREAAMKLLEIQLTNARYTQNGKQ